MAETALLAASFGVQGLTQIGSSYAESRAIKAQSRYESQQLEFNSKLADIQARQVEQKGKEEATQYKTQVKQLIGRQRTALAAQGIDVSSGSALDLQTETAQLGALDALQIRTNAFREATGYRIQSIDYSSQAEMTRLAGKHKAKSTLLTGGLKAAQSFAKAGYYGSKK